MLLLLISITWVAVVLTVMALCRGAARADALAPQSKPPALGDAPLVSVRGLTVWDCADPIRVHRLAVAVTSGAPLLSGRSARSSHGTRSGVPQLTCSRARGHRRVA